MEEQNGDKIKVHERIAILEQCYKHIEDDLSYIKRQVDNHLPTAIGNLEKKVEDYILRGKNQFTGILITLLILLIGVIVDIVSK
jgi:uncharacterized protein (DUF608 family)